MRRSHAAIAVSLCALSAQVPAGASDSFPSPPAFSTGTLAGSPNPPALACPDGFALDATRAEAVVAHLASVEHGRAIARDLTSATASMCFGVIDVSVVSLGGSGKAERGAQREDATSSVLLLDVNARDRALAARVAHLTAHLARASRFDPKQRSLNDDCTRWVDHVLRAEAEAFAIELIVARELGVTTPYAFAAEEAEHRATREERVDLIAAFLRAHPDGSAGIEPLARGYEERCRDAVRAQRE